MFKKNTKHLQQSMFGFRTNLPKRQQKELEESEENAFYELIFCNINEGDFSCLYSDIDSRPNAPINALVSSLILMHKRFYTYKELFNNIYFNLLTKTAIGLKELDELPFCPATLFNFQNRISHHEATTGENLLSKVFDNLTLSQLNSLKIKTNIQRTDTFFAASNIRKYSRLQLLVEVLIRLYRILDDNDKEHFNDLLSSYVQKTSDNYIYNLKASDIPHHLEKISNIYFMLYEQLQLKYSDDKVFQMFERVYKEHFKFEEDKIKVKDSSELNSDSLQSPDDIEATYRNKNDKESRGQCINIVETANPDNQINLITDVDVHANNINGDKVLNNRIDEIKEKTPDLDELHTDAEYGSYENDKKLGDLGITHVQTGIKGKTALVEIEIEQHDEKNYKVSCPNQTVLSEPSRKRDKANFNLGVCRSCKLSSLCPTIENKKSRVYYFTKVDYLRKKRLNAINRIPTERRKLRSNVEATVYEFVRKMPNKKLKVRGYFKTTAFAYCVAIAINFGRIFRYLSLSPKKSVKAALNLNIFVKEQLFSLLKLLYLGFSIKFRSNFSKKYSFA